MVILGQFLLLFFCKYNNYDGSYGVLIKKLAS